MRLVFVVLDDGVTTTDWYIPYSHIWLVASTNFELSLDIRLNHMNYSWRIFLKSKWLEPQKITWLWYFNIDQPIFSTIRSKNVWIRFFAYLTFKLFPCIGITMFFTLKLKFLLKPMFQAIVMDIANWPITFATAQKRIFRSLLISPANFTLNFFWLSHSTIDFYFFFLGVLFILCELAATLYGWSIIISIEQRRVWVTSKIFNLEFESSHFYGVSLSNPIFTAKWLLSFTSVFLLWLHIPYDNIHLVRGILSWSFSTQSIIEYVKLAIYLFNRK